MKQPKNVQAVLDWYDKNMPDQTRHVQNLLEKEATGNVMAQMCVALLLQGFEAGREFERAHPEVQSGIGYLTE